MDQLFLAAQQIDTINAGCNIKGHQIVRSYYRDSSLTSDINIRSL